MVREMISILSSSVFSNYLKNGGGRLVKNCHFLGDKKSYPLKRIRKVSEHNVSYSNEENFRVK